MSQPTFSRGEIIDLKLWRRLQQLLDHPPKGYGITSARVERQGDWVLHRLSSGFEVQIRLQPRDLVVQTRTKEDNGWSPWVRGSGFSRMTHAIANLKGLELHYSTMEENELLQLI